MNNTPLVSPPPLPPTKKSWVERHVLVVVFMVLALIGLMVVMCCGGAVALVFHLMRSSPVYTMAMGRLNQEPAIMQRIGEPIEPGWLMSGNVTITNGEGTAKMRIPLKGTKENVEVFIEAIKPTGGDWQLTYLAVQFAKDPDGQRVVVIDRGQP